MLLFVLLLTLAILGGSLIPGISSYDMRHSEQNSNHRNSEQHTRRWVLNHLLNRSTTGRGVYDQLMPPDYEQEFPTDVWIRIHVLSFDSVKEATMDYSINIYLTMEWIDQRLNYSSFHNSNWLEVDTKLMEKIWVPDVYFPNAKNAYFHDVTVPNKYMHIHKDARVEYGMRLSLTLNCRMVLFKYPLDMQKCPMIIQSYTYTDDNVKYHWLDKNADPKKSDSAITYNSHIRLGYELAEYTIVDKETCPCDGKINKYSPTFACIRAYFTLKRDLPYFLIIEYLPGTLIVILSWLGFWIDPEVIPARVSLGVLSVLTYISQSSTIMTQLPNVSYIKAIDIWVFVSHLFVFLALVEFAYVHFMVWYGKQNNVTVNSEDEKTKMEERDRYLGQIQLLSAQLAKVRDQCNRLSFDSHLEISPRSHVSARSSVSRNSFRNQQLTSEVDEAKAKVEEMKSLLENMKSLCEVRENKTNRPTLKSSPDVPQPRINIRRTSLSHVVFPKMFLGQKARLIDKFSRFSFPCAFLLFNIFYWLYFIYKEDTHIAGCEVAL